MEMLNMEKLEIFALMNFDISSVVPLRQSLVSARVSSGSQQFAVKYRVKFLSYNRLVFIRFYQLPMVRWEP